MRDGHTLAQSLDVDVQDVLAHLMRSLSTVRGVVPSTSSATRHTQRELWPRIRVCREARATQCPAELA
ncbi:hypothetical protein ACQRWP_17270 [Micromonospora trifolii]|uniref:hypothetical protein n=1 Tax=Micromonospora trifolii TaxID=2911208 RepID=UPI003D2F4B26